MCTLLNKGAQTNYRFRRCARAPQRSLSVCVCMPRGGGGGGYSGAIHRPESRLLVSDVRGHSKERGNKGKCLRPIQRNGVSTMAQRAIQVYYQADNLASMILITTACYTCRVWDCFIQLRLNTPYLNLWPHLELYVFFVFFLQI